MSSEPEALYNENGSSSTYAVAQELGPEDHNLEEWFKEYMAADGNSLDKGSALIQAVNSDELDAGFVERLVRESTPKDPAWAGFCRRCHRLLDNWPTLGASSTTDQNSESGPDEDAWAYAVAVSYSTFDLEGSARSGCKFCSFVLQHLKDVDLLDTFRKVEARLLRLQSTQKCSLTIQNWAGNQSQMLWLNFPGRECTQCNHGIASNMKFYTHSHPASADCYEEPREVLDITSTWLSKCSESHELCKVNEEGPLPTRLISLADETPRLVLTATWSKRLRYATLSHCWGNHDLVKLTSKNLRLFMEAIPLEILPKTFLEAIQIARHLGLDYIWIDRLCIIQNDKDDWQKEASMMSSVYGGSTINIAASSARDSTEGCFLKPANFVGGFRARVTEGGQQRVVDFRTDYDYDRSTHETQLGTRAWALQEKILSPRTVHFSDRGAFWECRTTIASEHLPDGYPVYLVFLLVRRTREFADMWCESMWCDIVRLYSAANLTFGKDKLPALSGIARLCHNQTGDQYLAGLWRSKILEQLCWIRLQPPVQRPPWRAPTWTWASIDGRVNWNTTQTGVLEATHIHVVDASIKIDGLDPFGQVTSGSLSLACSTMATGCLSQPNNAKVIQEGSLKIALTGLEKEEFTIQIDSLSDLEHVDTALVHFLPILSGRTGTSIRRGEDWIQQEMVEGILLRATGHAKGEYTRIGSFSFLNNRDNFSLYNNNKDKNMYGPFMKILEETGRVTAEAACAEVIVDPEHPDQQFVITII